MLSTSRNHVQKIKIKPIKRIKGKTQKQMIRKKKTKATKILKI